MASRHADMAAPLCAADTAMMTLASPIGTWPVRCAMATRAAPWRSVTWTAILAISASAISG